MTIVAMPDGTQVSFPDNMQPSAIKTLIQRKFPDAMEQAKASLATGLSEGKRGGDEALQVASFRDSQPSIADAVTDVPSEIANAAGEAMANIKGIANRGGMGPLEGLAATGKAVLGVPQLLMSPITGAARSLIGHPMAQLTQAAGRVIAPDIAEQQDPQKLYETAKGDVDLALTAAAPGKAKAVKTSAPSIQELKAAATADYKSPEVAGLEVKPTTIKDYSTTTQAKLNNDGFDENVAPKTFGILSKLEKIPTGATVTGQNFNSLRKMLGKAAGSIEPSEKAAASMAIEHLDEFIPKISPRDVISGDLGAAAETLDRARGNYNAASQAKKIDEKLVQAEIRAGAANSGMNVANTIRQRMADVVLKPKEARGLLPEEIDQAKAIAEGSRTQNAIRMAGNVLGGGGGLGTVAAATAGGLATGGPGALAPLAGFALRALSNKLTVRQAEKLSEAIRSRAPLASSNQKFAQAAAQLQQNRTPQTIAGAVIAARNLSTNLKGAGFNVSPADLLSGLQGPTPAGAENEQQ